MESSVGNRVKLRRVELGLTQKQLALAVGSTPQAITRLESGNSKTSRSLVKIADKLKTTVRWLTSGRENNNELEHVNHSQQSGQFSPKEIVKAVRLNIADYTSLGLMELSAEFDTEKFALDIIDDYARLTGGNKKQYRREAEYTDATPSKTG